MSVIDLAAKRLERGPHISGFARCMNPACKHQWSAVAPLPVDKELECPKCGLDRGVWAYNFAPASGQVFTCNACESQYFRVTRASITCIGCGIGTSFKELAE